ncbi:winged helix-turn-helix domain-containing protein [Methylomonas sp. SURF-2]|uniref:Winged helix-turn-helix domain-containing protein n=1 Tax=Methylomonas subterranea TaxID=2952225 RepID=A0ABT1TE63_9GAMM|nr:winged helix-turn-helix domain-containing protein [Methylomonas sp. SURF-2]MCQ8103754.1 winged helix-turn-helix domain-containing protein [Methylomonas sp. SURF-2]
MNKLNNIAILSNDEYITGLLKGYCFANNIHILASHDNLSHLAELQRKKPDMVFFSIGLFDGFTKPLTSLFVNTNKINSEVVFIGLNKSKHNQSFIKPEWFHEILNDPFDVIDIDALIKRYFALGSLDIEERRHGERRSRQNDRRGRSPINPRALMPAPQFVAHEIDRFLTKQDFKIDHNNRCVYLKGNKIDLTPKEYELLELLSSDLNRIYTADEILNHIWPENNRATKSDLYQYMHLLRKKIEKDPNNPKWLMNIKGFGYKLNIPLPDFTDSSQVLS